MATPGALYAVSDLHVDHRQNRSVVEGIEPRGGEDWLIVCGDVADDPAAVEWALRLFRDRFERVIWAPGNHELLAHRGEVLRGDARYRHLVALCRELGVLTPEDPYPVWEGADGPLTVAPMFLLYDYSFGLDGGGTQEEALRAAYDAGVVCVDEFLLDPTPYPSREAWCRARVDETERRLREVTGPTILVNHFPLVSAPTEVLRHPEFAQWCGTTLTADWHLRFRAAAVVYGHLHIPRTTWHDGVRFEEVSLGYPRERAFRGTAPYQPRQIAPAPSHA